MSPLHALLQAVLPTSLTKVSKNGYEPDQQLCCKLVFAKRGTLYPVQDIVLINKQVRMTLARVLT